MNQFPEIGKTLRSRYKLLKLLGSGGFGDTYLAADTDLPGQPQCVVKHLHPKNSNSAVLPIAKSLFEREAQILYRLGKANNQIPQLFAHFEEGGEFYLVQEFIDGHDLSEEIKFGVPKSENVVFKLLKDILEVLSFVHQNNAIHRDIKPQNLMRRLSDGKIVLIDFGAVKEISTLEINNHGQTSVTVAVGSPGYMPSEQANGKPKLCSDIYAVGMVGIQALTGLIPQQLPEDPTTGEVIWRDKARVSNRLADVLDKMVRDHFSQRYQSAQEALQALIATVVNSQPQAKPQSQSQSQPQSRPNLLLSIAGGVTIASVIAIIFIQRIFTSPSLQPDSIASPTIPTSPQFSSSAPNITKNNVLLSGAGASFPAPLYLTWFEKFNQQYPNIQINYQSIGSGAGVDQFTKENLDFSASDIAMTDEEIAKVKRGVTMLPLTAGGLVLAYNLPGVGKLQLPRQVYTDIYLGKIKSWNDPAIIKANPGVIFPNIPIKVLHRADGSITTKIFTSHLSAISPEWKTKVGDGKIVEWPIGIGAKGNEGVAAQIAQIQGVIGYLEYGFAKQNNLKMAALENKSGQFIEPTVNSFSQTLDAVTLPDNLRVFINDPEDSNSYPIVTYTWLLVYNKYNDPDKAATLKYFINWSLIEGQKVSPELGYAPLPPKVIEKVKTVVNKIF